MAKSLDSLSKIDLEQVKLQLMKDLGWDRPKVERLAWEYVQYLDQFVDKRDIVVRPPSVDVDKVWHQHILNTSKYTKDCFRFIGFFVHHLPDRIEHENSI